MFPTFVEAFLWIQRINRRGEKQEKLGKSVQRVVVAERKRLQFSKVDLNPSKKLVFPATDSLKHEKYFFLVLAAELSEMLSGKGQPENP